MKGNFCIPTVCSLDKVFFQLKYILDHDKFSYLLWLLSTPNVKENKISKSKQTVQTPDRVNVIDR